MMGCKTVSETAIGDNVNVAARQAVKKYKCQLVISKFVAEQANVETARFQSDTVKITPVRTAGYLLSGQRIPACWLGAHQKTLFFTSDWKVLF